MCSLGSTLLAFALLHSVLQGQICLLFQAFLDFILLHSSPLLGKGHILGVLFLEGVVGLHRTVQLQLLQHYNNLRYADDTTLKAENKEELKSLLMKVKKESEKAG